MKPRYVVDSNVAAKWFFSEVHSDRANIIRGDWKLGAIELFAPSLFVAEIGNVFWKRAVLQQDMGRSEVTAVYDELAKTPPALIDIRALARAHSKLPSMLLILCTTASTSPLPSISGVISSLRTTAWQPSSRPIFPSYGD